MLKKKRMNEAAVSPTSTEALILKEAESLGEGFTRVTVPIVDMLEEAEEMLLARGDVAEFVARRYRVTDDMFERVKILANMLTPDATKEVEVEVEPSETSEETKAAHKRLLEIREQMAQVVDASGLDASKLAVDSRRYKLLVTSMAEAVQQVRTYRKSISDPDRIDALLAEATELLDVATAQSLMTRTLMTDQKSRSLTTMKLKRLLADQLRYLSKQGTAAFPHDIKRRLSYRLERFMPKKAKAKPAEPDAPEPKSGDDVV